MIDYDLSRIVNLETTCYQYAKFEDVPAVTLKACDWRPSKNNLIRRLDPKTKGLIDASEHIHLPRLHKGSIMEWWYRLHHLWDAGVAFLAVETYEGWVPLPLRIQDLEDHLGLEVMIDMWPAHRFDREIRRLRTKENAWT